MADCVALPHRAPPPPPATRRCRAPATKTTTLRYGGQLTSKTKYDDTIDYSNTVGYDTTAYPDKWESVTHSVHTTPGGAKPTEFSTSFHLGETEFTNPEKAEEYRAKW